MQATLKVRQWGGGGVTKTQTRFEHGWKTPESLSRFTQKSQRSDFLVLFDLSEAYGSVFSSSMFPLEGPLLCVVP